MKKPMKGQAYDKAMNEKKMSGSKPMRTKSKTEMVEGKSKPGAKALNKREN